jgi:hypothetical protein
MAKIDFFRVALGFFSILPLAPVASALAADTIVNVTQTIVLNERGRTYDFSGKLHVWKGRNWNCNAEREDGPQILRVEADNITVKNFKFIGDGRTNGSNGLGDPIHVASCGDGQGNLCSRRGPRNVVLDGIQGHACEDMITIGTPGSENITIQNSVLRATPRKASWDKTIQINFGKNIRILNNRFEGGVRCVRFKPNTTGEVRGNTFNGCGTAIQASSNDADIKPMRNGPTVVTVRNNRYVGVGTQVRKIGSQVTIK